MAVSFGWRLTCCLLLLLSEDATSYVSIDFSATASPATIAFRLGSHVVVPRMRLSSSASNEYEAEENDDSDSVDESMIAAFEQLNELDDDVEAIQALRDDSDLLKVNPPSKEFHTEEVVSTDEGFELFSQTMSEMEEIFHGDVANKSKSSSTDDDPLEENSNGLENLGLSASTLDQIFRDADKLWGKTDEGTGTGADSNDVSNHEAKE
mmetsp:Transcript_6966/g.12126  ORF Transcript_6966/g.12126 Transcript_6966/m.12126 type:complete len:208 (-) Transcript_6966:187-810(-)